MKRFFTLMTLSCCALMTMAQGWPSQYEGVMLQGFYWDSFSDSKWTNLEEQADELSQYFSLVWLPQSANCGGTSMGYDDLYWFPGHYDSSFGTETELRSLINTFKAKGIGTIADVVINHRKNVSNWVDFPRETYKGVTYELISTDICANDDGGKTKTWATQNGYSLSSYNDTGEGWDGMRDLDHRSQNVQTNVKAYLGMLLNDLGYVGFRYDMVKGYSGTYTKMYNEDAQPQFSVGECWDGTNTIKNWIEATGKTSAAFDFQFRYTVRNAANNGDWRKLMQQNDGNWPLVSSNYNEGAYRRYAVTFVENHDTEKRSNAAQDPLKKDTLAANAYLLAMPGTPCIFFKHWQDCKQDIKAMIDVRKTVGVHNQSEAVLYVSQQTHCAVSTTGSKGEMLAVVGPGAASYTPNEKFVKVLAGYHYAYYMNKAMNTAWADMSSGDYEANELKVMLTAVSSQGANLVYTLDGSTPTAASTQVTSGTTITLPVGQTTLKVGLLINGVVSGIVTRTYNIAPPVPFEAYDINVYVNADAWSTTLTSVNFWTWGGNGTHAPSKTTWPGDAISTYKMIDGKKWFYKTFTISSKDDFVNFVFSTGSGSPQTVDINNIIAESYFEVATTKDGANHNYVTDRTSLYSEINSLVSDPSQKGDGNYYTIDGRRLNGKPTQRGLYIINGKKVVIK